MNQPAPKRLAFFILQPANGTCDSLQGDEQ